MNYPDIVGDEQVQGLPPGARLEAAQAIARTLFAAATPASVGAGASVDFEVQVQVPMRLEQLILVDETNGAATTLRVTGIRVGPANQIVSNGGSLPLRMFAPESFYSNMLKGNTARPGTNVIITVQNPGLAAATVAAGMKGTALTGA